MKVFDVSMPIYEGMPVYKNKPEKQPQFEVTSDHAGHHVRETRIHMDVHCGTHVDAPLHMVEHGATIETLRLDQLVRPCRVIDLMHVNDAVHADDLRSLDPKAGDFLLLKTKNSLDLQFNPSFIYVAEDAARFAVSCGIAGFGIDGLGIERSQEGHPTHKALFEAGIVIIEGLRLVDVPPGDYLMVAAPLKLQGLDAAPARVLLIQD
ncbi:MAG: cyclase family protein [Alicyclobacillus sp.]|nr:cyclase family protein [Alicyclobacillus sp.]